MMRFLAACLGVVAVLGAASGAQAAVDGSEPVICASVTIMECVPDGTCQRINAEEAGIPRFLRVDFAGQRITRTRPNGDDVSSQIERSESVDGRLILQGAEDGFEGVSDGIGWSLSIDEETGNMVIAGSGEDVAFVIFGACTVY
jgi:hypothetical protein